MSLALFRSTLRSAVRDVLADEAECSSWDTTWSVPSATSIQSRESRQLSRDDLVVNAGLEAPERAP
jgi:hypothetical protein